MTWYKTTVIAAPGRSILSPVNPWGKRVRYKREPDCSWVVFDKEEEQSTGALRPLSFHETPEEASKEIARLIALDPNYWNPTTPQASGSD